MKVPVWALAIGAGAASVIVVAACVGEDPDATSGRRPGELNGPCDQGICLSRLECDKSRDVCVPQGEAGTSSSGGSSGGSSGTSSSGADATPGTCPFTTTGSTQVPCPGVPSNDCGGNKCCLTTGGNTCTNTTLLCTSTTANSVIECTSKQSQACGGTMTCCLDSSKLILPSDPCPTTLSNVEVDTRCRSGCPPSEYLVCRDDGDCTAPKKCRSVVVKSQGGDIPLGVCL